MNLLQNIKEYKFAYLTLLLASIFQLVHGMSIDLFPDETYYWEWSRSLDFSFYDQGPGIGLYIKLFTSLFGNTQFALKLGAVFASTLSVLFIFLSGQELGLKNHKSWIVLILTLVVPGFFGGYNIIVHDSALMLCWTISLYSTIRYIQTKENKYIYVLFLFLGLGGLSKHTMVLFAISLMIWLVLSPKEFRLLKNFHFWLGLSLAFAIVSPILYWNLHHSWDNIDAIIHLRSAGGADHDQIELEEFILGQVLTLSPILFLSIVLITIIGLKDFFVQIYQTKSIQPLQKIFQETDPIQSIWKFLIINASFVIFFFVLNSLNRKVQANWVFPAYPAIILILGYSFYRFENRLQKFFKILIYSGILVAFIFGILSKWSGQIVRYTSIQIPPHINTEYKNKGFKEIISIVQDRQKKLDPNAIIIANRYQDASIASFYLSEQPRIMSMNILQKNQYNYWNQMKPGKNYLLFYIQENVCEKSFIFFQPLLKVMFENVQEFPEEDLVIDNKTIKRYQIWYLKNYKESWGIAATDFFGQELREMYFPHLKDWTKPQKPNLFQSMIVNSVINYMQRKGSFSCDL